MKKYLFVFFLMVLLFSAGAMAQETELAVTVDDLPSSPETTQRIIAALQAHQVPEVYGFVNGYGVAETPHLMESLRSWVAAGFPLGNHTYTHIDLNRVSVSEFIQDIEKNVPLLMEISQGMHFKMFRYPFLHEGADYEHRDGVRNYLAVQGYTIAQVSVDTQDWAWTLPYSRCLSHGDTAGMQRLEDLYIDHAIKRFRYARASAMALYGRDIRYVALVHSTEFQARVLGRLLESYEALLQSDSGILRYIGLSRASRDPVYDVDTRVLMQNGMTFLDQAHLFYNTPRPVPGGTTLPETELNTICLM